MFNNLSDKLQATFKKLRGQATLTEKNIVDAMREIRLALLDADVNIDIVKDFIVEVKRDCLGKEVLQSITPGQQVIKVVNDRLVELMGESEVPLNISGSKPATIMMIGLHGSGKTTSAAKLALHLKKQNKKVMLVAGDIYRPAAIDQLEILGKEISVRVHSDRTTQDVAKLAKQAVEVAKFEQIDVVIIDTAGRLQIDDDMVQELIQINQAVNVDDILFVADSALGQEAVSVAGAFHKALNTTGIILTKIDGDARGGAALSVRKVTGCPIKFVGTGEKLDELDIFYPDRMASRILGMGDIVSLVEKATEEINEKEAQRLEERMRKNLFDFNDFYDQLKQMKKMGGLGKILSLMPGGSKLKNMTDFSDEQFLQMEAIIQSMSKGEKTKPKIIDFSRRKRIAKGSGTTLEDVSQVLKKFTTMRKMMKNIGAMKRIAGGDVSPMASGTMPSMKRGANFTPKKKKRKKKKR